MATVKLTDRAVLAARSDNGKRRELWDSNTPGLCLRISESGKKVWIYRYRTEDGRQPRLTLGQYSPAFGLAEARAAAARLKVNVQDGNDPAAERRKRIAKARAQPLKTFNDLAEAYFAACESGYWRPRNKKKKAKTIQDERKLLNRHIKRPFGALRVEEIDKATIKQLLRDMLDRGIRVQTNRTHALIRQVFSYAVSEERVPINPASAIKPMADEKPRERVLNDAELKALWAALESPVGLRKPIRKGSDKTVAIYVGRPMAICVQLCAILLQRRTEIAGMMIDEVNLEGAVWTIPGERMKGSRTHIVYLPPRSVELIREAIALGKERYGDDVAAVFPGGHDETHGIRPDSVTHTMRDIIAALGLKNASPHDLRRTGATNMVSERLRFAPFIVSQVLGHISDTGGAAAVTLAHYALYNYAAEKRGALEAWEKLLLEVVGKTRRPSLPPGRMQPTLSMEGPAGSERGRPAPWLAPDQDHGFHHRIVLAADHLIRTYGASMSFVELADWIRLELERAGGAQPLPEDPALWRAVVVELRRRSIRAV
jgi:integrase